MQTEKHNNKNLEQYTGAIPRNPISFAFFSGRSRWWLWILAAVGVIIAQTAGSLQSYLISEFVDELLATTVLAVQMEVVFKWAVLFVALMACVYAGWRTSGYASVSYLIHQHQVATQTMYDYVVRHSHAYFSNRFAGSIANHINHVADGSSQFLMSLLLDVTRHATSIIVSGLLLLLVNTQLSIAYFVVVILALILNYYLVGFRRPRVVAYAAARTKARGFVIDILTNIQAVRQFSRYHSEQIAVNTVLSDQADKDRSQWFFAQHINLINNILAFLLTIGVLTVAYQLLRMGIATPGQVILAMMSSFTASYSILSIGEVMNKLIRFYGEADEGLEAILIDHEIVDAPKAKKLKAQGGQIDWQNVTFEYGANRVFNDFNLSIEPGQRVGLVGPSGAGKTTFVSLLLRQHDIHAGAIMVDGQDIAQVTQDSLREQIAVVPQEPMLFHRSIKENIAYGKPNATNKEIIAVAEKAQAHEFIQALEYGYDTLVGERGVKLSGGQKQRIAIARAMLKNAPILVLDEATSALDSESEVAIQKALQVLMEGKTVVAIAHRLSTLRKMDRILVLEGGMVVEDGTHDELSKADGTYQRLWEHQAGGFIVE